MAEVRKDLIGIIDWLETEVEHLNIEIRRQQYADVNYIMEENPDIVIVATGGIPDLEYIKGLEDCLSTWDVLSGQALINNVGSSKESETNTVLVYDDHGQHQAASTVIEIAKRGYQVELVTPDRHMAAEMGSSNFPMYMKNFKDYAVTVTPDFRLVDVSRSGNKLKARFSSDYGGHITEKLVDHIVIEHGTVPVDELYQELCSKSINDGVTDITSMIDNQKQPYTNSKIESFNLYRVGDAVASRNIHAAIFDSRRLCQNL
jgi:hypothetical protein